MKTYLLILTIVILIPCSLSASPNPSEISTFTQVWGFLKYYHPGVAGGKIEWDDIFLNRVLNLPDFQSPNERSEYYLEWIDALGKVKECRRCENDIPDSLKPNLNLDWLHDTSRFDQDLIQRLDYVVTNRHQGKQRYVKRRWLAGNPAFNNENPYTDSIYPSAPMRLLTLARYWNIIEYFHPSKYLIGEDWQDVLTEFTPKFIESSDTAQYHMTLKELIARINDSHSYLGSKYTYYYFGDNFQPFEFEIINNEAVVTRFYNDSLCAIDDIQIGDAFTSFNGNPIGTIIKERGKYASASNDAVKLRALKYGIFTLDENRASAIIERDGIEIKKTIHLYQTNKENFDWHEEPSQPPWKILDSNIGYINLDDLHRKECSKILKELKSCDALIFDVRNYPDDSMYRIADFLNSKKRKFAKFTQPDLSYPGTVKYSKSYTCGHRNRSSFKGEVAILFNEETQSHGEFTLMALQTADNVISIGSQTAGADGNVSEITLPGGFSTYISGLGVYYPDGRETQRIGIVPDIEVKRTKKGIRDGRDEMLDRALEYFRSEL